MLSLCLVWCTFVALSDPFSSAITFWWSLKWSLNRSLTVCWSSFFYEWIVIVKMIHLSFGTLPDGAVLKILCQQRYGNVFEWYRSFLSKSETSVFIMFNQITYFINLTNKNILDWSKLKALADDKINGPNIDIRY